MMKNLLITYKTQNPHMTNKSVPAKNLSNTHEDISQYDLKWIILKFHFNVRMKIWNPLYCLLLKKYIISFA